eukprot:Skav208350  [mRNA]  locus=scaffold4040:184479:184733:+ [translate_table: standard]
MLTPGNPQTFGASLCCHPAVEVLSPAMSSTDALSNLGAAMFDDAMMAQKLPSAVLQRFNQCLITGEPTTEDDQKAREMTKPPVV